MADKPKPKITRRCLARMARRLARVGEDLRCLGADMDYYGGFGLIGVHGREMLGAAQMTKAWSSHIGKMAETLKHGTVATTAGSATELKCAVCGNREIQDGECLVCGSEEYCEMRGDGHTTREQI